MSLVQKMAALKGKLIEIPDKMGYPLYLVEELNGVGALKCFGKKVNRTLFVNSSEEMYQAVSVIDEFMEVKIPVSLPKPDQEFLKVNGIKFRVIGVDRTVLDWVVSLKKDLDIYS